jgi:hypothetical protein
MAIAMALQNSFTWNAEHLHISRMMDMSRKSRDLVMIESLLRGAGVVTPLIGGLIVATFGQAWLTAIASGSCSHCYIPIWRLDKLGSGHETSTNLKHNLRQAPARGMIANFGYNAHTLVGIMVWPIYLAVFIPNFRDIDIITTVASFIAVLILLVAGKQGDDARAIVYSLKERLLRLVSASHEYLRVVTRSLSLQSQPLTMLHSHTRQIYGQVFITLTVVMGESITS